MFKFKDGVFDPKTKEKFIKDTFFGGAEKEAGKMQAASLREAQGYVKEARDEARGDIFNLYPAAEQNLHQGFQGALDVFGQSVPAQIQAQQQGTQGAQQALLAGAPQYQNAILGNAVDYGALQPQQFQMPDTSFLQQQLPEYTTIPQAFGIDPADVGEGETLGSLLAGTAGTHNAGTGYGMGGFGGGSNGYNTNRS